MNLNYGPDIFQNTQKYNCKINEGFRQLRKKTYKKKEIHQDIKTTACISAVFPMDYYSQRLSPKGATQSA